MPDIDILNALIAVFSIVASVGCSIWQGSVAGQKAAREFEEEKAAKARVTALKTLSADVKICRNVAHSNCQKETEMDTVRGIVRMPVNAFETAFVSGEPGLNAGQDTVAAVTGYLAQAYHVNAFVELYFSLSSIHSNVQNPAKRVTLENITKACEALPLSWIVWRPA